MIRDKYLAHLIISMVLIGLCSIPLLYAQGNPAISSVKELDQEQTVARAATLPTSDNLVSLQIIVGGQIVKATQREGGLIRIEYDGRIVGITPRIRDLDEEKISVDIFRITKIVRNGVYVGDAIAMAQTLDVNKLAATVPDSAPILSIQVEGIRTDLKGSTETQRNEPALERYGKVRKQECCITCGTITACGCSVSIPLCGSCCSGLCCEGGGGDRANKGKSN
jgi:hypothetical protein